MSHRLIAIVRVGVLVCGLAGPLAVAAAPRPSRRSAAPPAARKGYDDGWKWYLHRRAAGAKEEELVDILKTIKAKYGASGLSLFEVDQELTRYTRDWSVPRRGASAQAAFEDGWKWYLHRTSHGAKEAERLEILATLKKKYVELGVDMSRVDRELARFREGSPGARAARPAAAPLLPVATDAPLVEPVRPHIQKPPPAKPEPVEAQAARDARLRQRLADLESPDPKLRLKAVKDLKEMKDPRAVVGLIKRLGDADKFVSIVAANALVRIGEPSLEPLMAAAGDPDPNVRLVSCVALGDLGHPAAIPVLEATAKGETGEIRQSASNALNKIRAKSAQGLWTETTP